MRILIVDDEQSLTRLLQRHLQNAGHAVQCYSEPKPALLDLESAVPSYDLLITDMSMPQMSGLEIATAALAHNPKLRVLLCSGYPIEPPSDHRMGFLLKPFMPRMLTDAIDRLFGGTA